MNGILVYAKTRNERQFIGIFNNLEDLHSEVIETLGVTNRPDLSSKIYFSLNGEEYKLFMEGEK
ncbi:hypothetical protein EQ871_14440 [Enterococcus casseliflavus]|uniref:hypothetical protein n=1 Tax=Enterococcus TaxID=1350 RepID=UPI000FFC06BA|nr:hypothetical protein [Enterococcus casseliflavus]RXA60492.1 hypothetical protein EQ871_14440 [Enterococcus casseliflavus]WEL48759.1 hypothetical protein P0G38_06785 [Enterococcus casseliflavus]